MRKPPNIHMRYLVLLVAAALVLSACAPAAAGPAPTQTANAIYTAAAQTFTAQLTSTTATATATQTALPSPVPTTGAASPGIPITGGTPAQACNNAVYVNDVTIPDGTVMPPSQAFTKTWTVMNTGTCAWTTDYKLVFINGESMGGTSVPLTGTVNPGTQAQVSVNLTSPVLPGNYTGSWRLEDPQGNRFGEFITVVIVVSGTGGTSITATP